MWLLYLYKMWCVQQKNVEKTLKAEYTATSFLNNVYSDWARIQYKI